MTTCGECERLEREKQQARAERDLSRVSDCVVLLRRHPEHDDASVPREVSA